VSSRSSGQQLRTPDGRKCCAGNAVRQVGDGWRNADAGACNETSKFVLSVVHLCPTDRQTDNEYATSLLWSHAERSNKMRCLLACYYTVWQNKGTKFSFVCICFTALQTLVNFFTQIRPKQSRSISYNSVYLIFACVENFAATVTLNILYLPVK